MGNVFVAVAVVLSVSASLSDALIPLIDGGKQMPALYKGWLNGQIAKQAATAVGKAVAAGNKRIEVNFPPVPNLEEVRFGTPLNQLFGKDVVGKDLKIKGGYTPGSDLSRQLVAFGNIYWAKQIAPALGGPFGSSVTVLTSEQVTISQIQDKGTISRIAGLRTSLQDKEAKVGALIVANPGGEETWDRIVARYQPSGPFVVLNNAYSTTYDLGNKKGYEEAYFLKRISKGWVFRTFPGPWQAILERPDGTTECLQTYAYKPSLKEVSALVRDESFKRYAISNDRWTTGFGGRL